MKRHNHYCTFEGVESDAEPRVEGDGEWVRYEDAMAALAAERERCLKLPRLPTPRLLASGTIAGKRIELHGWHTEDIEIWQRQHGLKFGA